MSLDFKFGNPSSSQMRGDDGSIRCQDSFFEAFFFGFDKKKNIETRISLLMLLLSSLTSLKKPIKPQN